MNQTFCMPLLYTFGLASILQKLKLFVSLWLCCVRGKEKNTRNKHLSSWKPYPVHQGSPPSIKGWLVSSLLLKSPILLSPCNLHVASIPSESLLVYSSQSTFYLQHLILSICPNHLIWHSFSWSQLKISFYLFILDLSFLFLLLHIHLFNCIKFILNKMLLVSFVLLATYTVPKATCHFCENELSPVRLFRGNSCIGRAVAQQNYWIKFPSLSKVLFSYGDATLLAAPLWYIISFRRKRTDLWLSMNELF